VHVEPFIAVGIRQELKAMVFNKELSSGSIERQVTKIDRRPTVVGVASVDELKWKENSVTCCGQTSNFHSHFLRVFLIKLSGHAIVATTQSLDTSFNRRQNIFAQYIYCWTYVISYRISRYNLGG
jgi:hypothetical protein